MLVLEALSVCFFTQVVQVCVCDTSPEKVSPSTAPCLKVFRKRKAKGKGRKVGSGAVAGGKVGSQACPSLSGHSLQASPGEEERGGGGGSEE